MYVAHFANLQTFKATCRPRDAPLGDHAGYLVIKVTFRYLKPHRRTEGSRDVYLVLYHLPFCLAFGGHLGVEGDFHRIAGVLVLSKHRDVSPLDRALQPF